MSLYDRDSGDEDERPRRMIQGCKDGLCGATDCPKCGHATEEDECETWAGRCARIERLRKRSAETGVPIVTAVQRPRPKVQDNRTYHDYINDGMRQ